MQLHTVCESYFDISVTSFAPSLQWAFSAFCCLDTGNWHSSGWVLCVVMHLSWWVLLVAYISFYIGSCTVCDRVELSVVLTVYHLWVLTQPSSMVHMCLMWIVASVLVLLRTYIHQVWHSIRVTCLLVLILLPCQMLHQRTVMLYKMLAGVATLLEKRYV